MDYYFFIKENKIIGVGQCPCSNEDIQNIETTQEMYNNYVEDNLRYVWDGEEVIPNPNYEEEAAARHREELDQLSLTPADVERALFDAKEMDFDDLKALIVQHLPQVNLKRLSIEFRARDFYRGAMFGNIRLFDTVGALLGFTPEDMDYLFLNGSLPDKN